VAHRVAPATAQLDAEAIERFFALIEAGLAVKPPPVRRQFALFLSVLRVAPLLRYGRLLDRLEAPRLDAVLRAFEGAPIQLLRTGFWGLRTMVYLGYYGLPETADRVAYRPTRCGNPFLHAR
jgi:hypothetical protein